ncbi:PadR family transcriptional regulator [Microbacterium sp. CFBP9034]|uniref:PadR family transcriptional regulator n=1 Tax=Microbacterium sp. CFBP9034 TaxID=3096540 RepID=UPI002A6B4CFC|nr:PadR family transcriptional regulator [Microbacterium sp. CFBP9034]MDY0908182.1 PadR family transcriptional regulator [Microbacterium sp. CFBP9034]
MTNRELPTTAYITLGLLASRDWSAYQLAEQVGRGVDQLWPRAERQRYNTLKRLVADGLVATRSEHAGKRPRTMYSLTPAGRDELGQWLATTAAPPALEFEGMVRVLMSDHGSIDDLRRTLEEMRADAAAKRALFAEHAAYISATGGTFPERRHLFGLANTFMIGHFDHIIGWATWALAQIERWPDTVAPAADDAQVRELLAAGLRAGEPPRPPGA